MDADGLPIVGPGINLAEVEPVNQKRMLAFLNHFIVHTVGFLNRFSVVCEEKLENLTIRIQRLETALSILETKLSSIPGLDDITSASVQTPSAAASTATVAAAVNAVETTPATGNSSITNGPAASTPDNNTEPDSVTETPANKASTDPRYAKYFRMLHLGVAREAVQQKMTFDGYDPAILDNPNAAVEPAPVPAASQRKARDSEDFSDDDDRQSTSSSPASDSDFS